MRYMRCMMYVEPFICTFEETRTDEKGKSYTFKCNSKAKNAREDIEIDTIVSGCDNVSEIANTLTPIINDIDFTAGSISKDDLSIHGQGVDNLSTNCLADLAEQKVQISEHISGVKERAISVFNERQTYYNDVAKQKCQH